MTGLFINGGDIQLFELWKKQNKNNIEIQKFRKLKNLEKILFYNFAKEFKDVFHSNCYIVDIPGIS